MRIAVLTGGGDAPGMNAAVRAVARTAFNRILASRLGAAAVEALAEGESRTMVGVRGERDALAPLEEVIGKERVLDPTLYQLAEVLSELPE